jgi:hypothetical protein
MANTIRKSRVSIAVALGGLLSITTPALSGAQSIPFPTRPGETLVIKPKPALGPMVLRLPASARIAALANAGIASTDADALLYNPGMLPVARGMSASVQRYGSAGTAGSFATVAQAGTLSFGVGGQFVDYTADPVPVPVDQLQRYRLRLAGGATSLFRREGIPASSAAFTLGIARTVKGYRFGVSAKYAEDRIGFEHDGTVAFDIGLYRPTGPGTLALVAQNLGKGTEIAGMPGALPRRLGVGFGGGTSLSEHVDLSAQMQLTVENDFWLRPAGGVELGYVPIEGVSIVFRTGLRLPKERDEPLVTGGLGFTYDRISLDYAAEPFRDGRPFSHRVGLRVR